MGMTKQFTNLGADRYKRPKKNIIIKVRIVKLYPHVGIEDNDEDAKLYEKYKYGDGYLTYGSGINGGSMAWHGFVTPDELKIKLGTKNWLKFGKGEMEFVIQHKVRDSRNVSDIYNR